MVKNNIVENIAAWDEVTPWNPEGFELIDITDIPRNAKGKLVDIGWLKIDDTHFQNPDDNSDKIDIPPDALEE